MKDQKAAPKISINVYEPEIPASATRFQQEGKIIVW